MPSPASVSLNQDSTPVSTARWLPLLVVFLVLAKCAWLFGEPLRSVSPPLRFAQDDFYYYLEVARNLAWAHRSTFDGATLTNGYHPLYLIVLTAVSLGVHSLRGIFRFLWILDTGSALAIFLLTRRLFSRVGSALLANALAVLMVSLCFTLLSDQMEVTLALPLGFAFLLLSFVVPEELTLRRAAAMGLTGAMLFLSRLDAALLVVLYAAGMLASRSYRAKLTPGVVGAFLAAALPLPLLYLWSNHHFFHTLLPISGMAKQLRHGHLPSSLLPRSFNGTNEALALLTVFSAVMSWALRRRLGAREKLFLLSTLGLPLIFYSIEMVVSDWPLWDWYFYALRFAAAGAAVLFAVCLCGRGMPWPVPALFHTRGFALGLLLLAAAKLFVANYRVDSVMVEIQHASQQLVQFRESHPGVYAMGDRSGMFALLSGGPVVQAEGLMMDRSYLQHVRHEDDLRTVLMALHVDYYVAFVFTRNHDAQWRNHCFYAQEPSIPGPSALRLRSTFCQAPVLQIPGMDGSYAVFRLSPG